MEERAILEAACRAFLAALPALERAGFERMATEHRREAWQEVAAALAGHFERWLRGEPG